MKNFALLTIASAVGKAGAIFALFCKNRYRFTNLLDVCVYAQHGREFMGCKSPVGKPKSPIRRL